MIKLFDYYDKGYILMIEAKIRYFSCYEYTFLRARIVLVFRAHGFFGFPLPKTLTDAISIGYVCGDTVDKAYGAYSEGGGAKAAVKVGFDVLLWQSLASVAVPGLTINIVVSRLLYEEIAVVCYVWVRAGFNSPGGAVWKTAW